MQSIRVKVLVTLLVDPESFTAEQIEDGLSSSLDTTGLSLQETPELLGVEVDTEGAVWEDGSAITTNLPGWVSA